MPDTPIITLTTDFGLADHFVGTMKGVMLSINPEARFVDISHEVSSHDLLDGALTLALAYPYFPPNTTHLVIVDPGVGSSRRAIIATTRCYKFVAPDNGILSIIYDREPDTEIRHVTADEYFVKPVSQTFHGRDIFAPVTAWLSKGIAPEKFGNVIQDPVRLDLPKITALDGGGIRAMVIKVDKFGNLITNISPADMQAELGSPTAPFRIIVNQREITRVHASYAEGEPSELFAIAGSSGFMEVCQNRMPAAKALQAGRGTEVLLISG